MRADDTLVIYEPPRGNSNCMKHDHPHIFDRTKDDRPDHQPTNYLQAQGLPIQIIKVSNVLQFKVQIVHQGL